MSSLLWVAAFVLLRFDDDVDKELLDDFDNGAVNISVLSSSTRPRSAWSS